MKITGLDQLQKKLDAFARKAESLNGTQSVQLNELLNESFIQSCSQFTNLDEFFAASNFNVESVEDFKAIPEADLDAFVADNTSYNSWSNLLAEATKKWVAKTLNF